MSSAVFCKDQAPLDGKKILILIGSHLANAPRSQKEAVALRAAGARVLIRGTWWNPTLAAEDMALAKEMDVDFAPVVDLRDGSQGRFALRLSQRFARECFTNFGLLTPRAYGLGAPELLREARRINADLTMVHSEVGLWVGTQLLGEGRRVGVDFEDWFSQDLPFADRKGRPVVALQAHERYLLSNANCCLTTSQALAVALATDAGTNRVPVVAPNCFPASTRAQAATRTRDAKPEGVVSFHWFSQTIGRGRGLEALAQALPLLRGEWQLTLRGSLRGNRAWYEDTFPEYVRAHIHLLDPVPNSELLSRTMSHHVGLALEVPSCPSRDLTATNKIFEYLRAGLAVIATRTHGQEEVMRACPCAGDLIPPEDPAALAAIMQKMMDDAEYLDSCRRFSTEAGGTVWSWETHEAKLVGAISDALVRPMP
jgi:glycosyltransferase involved in cell wall biosynthesis